MKPRSATLVAAFVLGAYALCAQAVLLREAQVLLFGSELVWGMVLAFWLVGVAAGAQAGGRLARTVDRATWTLLAAGLAMPVILTAEVALLRSARSFLDVGPGEYIGPGAMTLIALIATAPVSAWVGLAFPAASVLAAAEARSPVDRARAVGWVYLVESAGSLAGGVLFSFVLVHHLRSIVLGLLGGQVLAVSLLPLASICVRGRRAVFVVSAVAGVLVLLTVTGAAGWLDRATVRQRWESFAAGLELVESRDTRYQNLALGRLGNQFSLYTSGLVAATWPNHQDLAVEAHLAACEHPSPRRILVLGRGPEGILKELLRYRPERLDYVTLDPGLLDLVRDHLAAEDRQALDQVGDRVHYGDARRFVLQAAAARVEPYDLVLLAEPEPASALEARLYTQEFFAAVSDLLSADGVLAFALSGSVGFWSPEPAAYVGSIVEPLERVFPEVLLTFGYPTRVFAAKRKGVLTGDGAELAGRYRAAGVTSPYFDPLWFQGATDMLDPAKRAAVIKSLRAYPPEFVNTDARPIAAFYHMRFWLQAGQAGHEEEKPPAAKRTDLLGILLGLRMEWAMLAVVAATLLAAAAGAVRGRAALRRTAVLWSVATTGLAAMALEVVLLYAFQTLYGYVYSMVGLVVGVFMFGLVLGSWAMNGWLRRSEARPTDRRPGLRTLAGLDLAMMVFAACLVLAMGALRLCATDWLVQAATFALVAAAGVLGGLVFPLATAVALEDRPQTGRAAGAVDAADNLGACLGAMATGVVLVPILGTSGACLLVAAVKALSALWVGVAATISPQAARGAPPLASA